MTSGPRQDEEETPSVPGTKFDIDVADPKERIQAYLDAYANNTGPQYQGIDEPLMREHLRIISATGPPNVKAVFEMEVTPSFSNRMGNMHGGAVALVFDMCTTMCAAPLARQEFWWFGGVSRNLSVTYLRPVLMGTTVRIECEVLQIGQRVATIRGVMRNRANDQILCVAEHNKVSINLKTNKEKDKGKL